jgi:hypothetical protein
LAVQSGPGNDGSGEGHQLAGLPGVIAQLIVIVIFFFVVVIIIIEIAGFQ